MIIERLQPASAIDQPFALMSEIFGPRQGAADHFSKWLGDPGYSVLQARNASGETVGVSVAHIDTDHRKFSRFGADALALLEGRRNGNFQLLAVAPVRRREGIAEALSLRQLQWMKESGCDLATGICWEHGMSDSSAHLFIKGGFQKIARAPDFYLEGSRKSQHRCPICRGECHCPSTLYLLHLR